MTELENVEAEPMAEVATDAAEEVISDAPAGEETPREDVIDQLVRGLAELRALVEARQEREEASAFQPTLTEAFRALYPDVAEGDVPDSVWEEVRGGLSLEAAYALWERREMVRRAVAQDANRKNATGAWGRADTASEEFLSPDEVRSMTRDEVRRHYARIVESMKHWN